MDGYGVVTLACEIETKPWASLLVSFMFPKVCHFSLSSTKQTLLWLLNHDLLASLQHDTKVLFSTSPPIDSAWIQDSMSIKYIGE